MDLKKMYYQALLDGRELEKEFAALPVGDKKVGRQILVTYAPYIDKALTDKTINRELLCKLVCILFGQRPTSFYTLWSSTFDSRKHIAQGTIHRKVRTETVTWRLFLELDKLKQELDDGKTARQIRDERYQDVTYRSFNALLGRLIKASESSNPPKWWHDLVRKKGDRQ